MKTYKIFWTEQNQCSVDIKAKNLDDAISKFEDGNYDEDKVDREYISGSAEYDEDATLDHNDE